MYLGVKTWNKQHDVDLWWSADAMAEKIRSWNKGRIRSPGGGAKH